MIIDMAEFQTITLDTATNIATVGAGVRLGNMAAKLFQLGQRGYVTRFLWGS
jgi:FAD/FMN-containing dehydrogenase